MPAETDILDEPWQRWRDQRYPAELLHLDTAAAGRCSVGTLRAAAAHAEREAARGAYVAQDEAAPVIDAGRAELAALLGVPPDGVAFVESASAALAALLAAWPLRPGDTVAVAPSEWGPNLTAFGNAGLTIAELPAREDGTVDLDHLERFLATTPPAFVHLTQVASHRTLVQPVAQAAAVCQAAGVPLWVDAAQALGHVDTATGADVQYATSRKWLTGPRGVGLLAVSARWWDTLRVRPSELAREEMTDACPVRFLQSHEANVPGWIGLINAVRDHLAAGPAKVWSRLAEVGSLTREALHGLPGWEVVGPGSPACAITALRPLAGQDMRETRARLIAEHGIVTTAAAVARAPREMTVPLLRVSPHVDCTVADLNRLAAALQAL
ncbi:MAG TPA: aminotransferase class V-fold PLP-dependent enzyme [Streptosporangiaceae bacterium]|nr:aminotransferase class V-fold PLP-dependent enzyme [Streptosporangiaceae bacterium]